MEEKIKIISKNKKAYFNYEIVETYEAGIVLQGSEVKAIREGRVNIKDSYVIISQGEAFLLNTHINPYKFSTYDRPDPTRKRKLLLHRREIDKLAGKIQTKGFSLIPLKIYFKNGKIKVEIGLGKGKKRYDKRSVIKDRDIRREMEREIKENRS